MGEPREKGDRAVGNGRGPVETQVAQKFQFRDGGHSGVRDVPTEGEPFKRGQSRKMGEAGIGDGVISKAQVADRAQAFEIGQSGVGDSRFGEFECFEVLHRRNVFHAGIFNRCSSKLQAPKIGVMAKRGERGGRKMRISRHP